MLTVDYDRFELEPGDLSFDHTDSGAQRVEVESGL